MDKPLTWQQVVIVLLVIAALGFAVCAWGGNIDPPTRVVGRYGFVATLAVMTALIGWHVARSRLADVYPDLLSAIVPPQSIFQIGQCHFHLFAEPLADGNAQLTLLVQNLLGGEGNFELRLHSNANDVSVPGVGFAVPPAALVRCQIVVVPVRSDHAWTARLQVDAKFRGKGKAIRFGRRRAVSKPVSPGVTALALLGGHLHTGGGTFLNVPIPPRDPLEPAGASSEDSEDAQWEFDVIWSLADWPNVDVVAPRLRQ